MTMTRLSLALALACLCACSNDDGGPQSSDGGRGGAGTSGKQGGVSGAGSAAGGSGAGQDGGRSGGGQCNDAADCALVPKQCCVPCAPGKADYEAVLAADEDAALQRNCPGAPVSCSPCPPPAAYDPLHPSVRAACKQNRCTVVDLREEPESACTSDGDCHLAHVGCCGSCGADPSSWISLSTAGEDPYAPVCDPVPPCVPCTMDAQPPVFCAGDGHCAVGERP